MTRLMPDGTIVDRVGNFVGIDQPAASSMRRTKLTDEDVRRIRVSAARGTGSYDLGEWFGVDPAYVRRLVRGEARPLAGGPIRERPLSGPKEEQ